MHTDASIQGVLDYWEMVLYVCSCAAPCPTEPSSQYAMTCLQDAMVLVLQCDNLCVRKMKKLRGETKVLSMNSPRAGTML